MKNHISDFLLERYLLGEVSSEEKSRIENALQEDPTLSNRLAALKKSNEDILRQYPSPKMIETIKKKADEQNKEQRFKNLYRYFSIATPVVMLTVILFLVYAPHRKSDLPTTVNFDQVGILADDSLKNGERAKGSTEFLIYRKTKEKSEESLTNFQTIHPKELLQVAYLSSGEKYGTIFSIDQDGQVTYHLPSAGSQSVATLQVGKKVYLPESYELDDHLGFEIFFFVSSRQPISGETIKKVVETLAHSPKTAEALVTNLLEGWRIQTFYLTKSK
jgi:hypothetical protein